MCVNLDYLTEDLFLGLETRQFVLFMVIVL